MWSFGRKPLQERVTSDSPIADLRVSIILKQIINNRKQKKKFKEKYFLKNLKTNNFKVLIFDIMNKEERKIITNDLVGVLQNAIKQKVKLKEIERFFGEIADCSRKITRASEELATKNFNLYA